MQVALLDKLDRESITPGHLPSTQPDDRAGNVPSLPLDEALALAEAEFQRLDAGRHDSLLTIHSVFTQYSLSIHSVFTQYSLTIHYSLFTTHYSLTIG